jgi:hypothetical protein
MDIFAFRDKTAPQDALAIEDEHILAGASNLRPKITVFVPVVGHADYWWDIRGWRVT